MILNEKHEPISLEVIQYKDYTKFNYGIFNNNRRKQNENFNLSELRPCNNKEKLYENFR